jgi:hypothetical protein
MATLIIEYDARNKFARKTIDYILSLGIFKVKHSSSGIDEALKDVKEGRVYKAESVDDMFKKILD